MLIASHITLSMISFKDVLLWNLFTMVNCNKMYFPLSWKILRTCGIYYDFGTVFGLYSQQITRLVYLCYDKSEQKLGISISNWMWKVMDSPLLKCVESHREMVRSPGVYSARYKHTSVFVRDTFLGWCIVCILLMTCVLLCLSSQLSHFQLCFWHHVLSFWEACMCLENMKNKMRYCHYSSQARTEADHDKTHGLDKAPKMHHEKIFIGVW